MTMDTIAPEDMRRPLWDSYPEMTFINLSETESFRSRHPMLLVRTRRSIVALPLVFCPLGELPFGRLSAVTCGDVPVAYALSLPRCRVRLYRNCVAVNLRAEIPDPSEIRRVFNDGTLVINGCDTAMVVALTNHKWLSW